MTTLSIQSHSHRPFVTEGHAAPHLFSPLSLLDTWIRRFKERRQLLQLSEKEDWVFEDLNMDRVDVLREAYKPFWRA